MPLWKTDDPWVNYRKALHTITKYAHGHGGPSFFHTTIIWETIVIEFNP